MSEPNKELKKAFKEHSKAIKPNKSKLPLMKRSTLDISKKDAELILKAANE